MLRKISLLGFLVLGLLMGIAFLFRLPGPPQEPHSAQVVCRIAGQEEIRPANTSRSPVGPVRKLKLSGRTRTVPQKKAKVEADKETHGKGLDAAKGEEILSLLEKIQRDLPEKIAWGFGKILGQFRAAKHSINVNNVPYFRGRIFDYLFRSEATGDIENYAEAWVVMISAVTDTQLPDWLRVQVADLIKDTIANADQVAKEIDKAYGLDKDKDPLSPNLDDALEERAAVFSQLYSEFLEELQYILPEDVFARLLLFFEFVQLPVN